jgi:two-component system cell cycle sensor histidine kinase/response regulator CckA
MIKNTAQRGVLMTKEKEKIFSAGRKWILIMAEEEGTGADMRRLLEKSGYRVYLAGNCDEAVECYETARDCGYPFAAVIMDTRVFDGREDENAIERLFAIDPDVRVVVSSGNAKNPQEENFRAYGFSGVLTEPFTREELDRALGMALSGVMGKNEKRPCHR